MMQPTGLTGQSRLSTEAICPREMQRHYHNAVNQSGSFSDARASYFPWDSSTDSCAWTARRDRYVKSFLLRYSADIFIQIFFARCLLLHFYTCIYLARDASFSFTLDPRWYCFQFSSFSSSWTIVWLMYRFNDKALEIIYNRINRSLNEPNGAPIVCARTPEHSRYKQSHGSWS